MAAADLPKRAAIDRWACFPCRWSAKVPLVDVRVPDRPSYACPRCGRRMRRTGNAFRPPRRADAKAWQVAERLVEAGHRFESTPARRAFPRTLRELEPWRAAQARLDGWLPERRLSVGPGASLSSGRRTVRDREEVLVLLDGRWRLARARLTGDGGVALPTPVLELGDARRVVEVSPTTRARLRRARPPGG